MTAFCGLAVLRAIGGRQDYCSLAYVLAVGLVILDAFVTVCVWIYGSTVTNDMALPPGVFASAGCRQSLYVLLWACCYLGSAPASSAVCVTITVAIVCVAVTIVVVRFPPGVMAAAGRRQGHAKYTLARCCGVVRCSTPRGFGSWLSGCTTTGTIVDGSDVAAASERINWTRRDRRCGRPTAERIMRTRQSRDCCRVASERINWTHHRDQACRRTASERINWTRRLYFVGCPAAGERIIWTRRLQQCVDRSG